MFKMPVRHLAKIQDVLKFLTFAFTGVVALDFAKMLWSNNYSIDALLIQPLQLVAIALVLATGWIFYLSSINSVVKPCVSEKDLALIRPDREQGALFSVYTTVKPCKKNMLPPGNTPVEIEEEKPIKTSPSSVEVIITLDGRSETSGYPIIKDKGGAIYSMDKDLWKIMEATPLGLVTGKKYRAVLNDDGIICQISLWKNADL